MKRELIVVAALAGCGDVVKNQPDAADVDAMAVDAPPDVDAAPDAPEGGDIHVRVLFLNSSGLPDTTAKVVFQSAAGDFVADGAVDANGDFTGTMPAGGGTVTVIRTLGETPTARQAQISSVLGVQPGETVLFGLEGNPEDDHTGTPESMTAMFTPVSTSTVTIYTPCGQSNVTGVSPQLVNFSSTCHGATFPVFARQTDANNAPKFASVMAATFADSGSFVIPNFTRAYSDWTLTVNNLPVGLSSLTPTHTMVMGHSLLNGETESPGIVGNPSGTQTFIFSYPSAPVLTSEWRVDLRRGDSTSRQQILGRNTNSVNHAEVDASLLALPWFTPGATVTTHSGVTWTVLEAGGQPDAMATVWSGQWAGDTRQIQVAWRITAPFSATGQMLPALPPAYAEIDPRMTAATFTASSSVSAYDYSTVPDYAAFRAHHDMLFAGSESASLLFPGQAFGFRSVAQLGSQ